MPQLAISLMGSPSITHNGAQLSFDTRKAVALLTYLACTQRAHSRDALAALLWPEYAAARNSLRRTLSTLQSTLGTGWLEIGRDQVALTVRPEVWVDVADFEVRLDSAADRVALAATLALYRGDFLAGFTLRDSPAFDEWQFFEAERIRQRYAHALDHLTTLHAGAKEYAAATDTARRRLALDMLHEPAHQALMKLYLAAGQRSAALRQYRECARVLEQELGVAPMDETVQLYEAIRAPPSTSAASAPHVQLHQTAPAPASAPLVGRELERTRLRAIHMAARAGAVAAIEGPPGIGKTRLAEDLLSAVRAIGAPTFTARCYEGEAGLAYAPVAALLREATAALERSGRLDNLPRDQLTALARLVPALARRIDMPEHSPVSGSEARRHFFEAVANLLITACNGPAPGVMLVDDASWADNASLDLLAFVARRGHGRPGLLLLTWRSEDVPASHPLRALITEARRAGTAEHLVLGSLSATAVAELAHAHRPTLPPDVVERLHRESEGLPLLVVEYLATMDEAALAANDGVWALSGSTHDILAARLRPLSEPVRSLLFAAAVIGRSFDFATLCAAANIHEELAVDGLDELVARGLVVETDVTSLRYDFSHAKLRDVALASTSHARQRLVHRRVGDYLAGLPSAITRPGLAARVAYHYEQAGATERAADFHRHAGDEARALYANDEALAHYAAALAEGHESVVTLQEAIGDLQSLGGNYTAALQHYKAACDVGSQNAVVERKLGEIHHRLGDWDSAETHFAAALAASSTNIAVHAHVLAAWSLTTRRRGDLAHAANLSAQALTLAEEAGDVQVLARAHGAAGTLAAAQGKRSTARKHLERGLALAEHSDDAETRVAALNSLALDLAHDDPARAIALAEAALALCLTRNDRHRAAALHNTLADLHHATGAREAALLHLREAVALFAAIGHDQPAIWMLTEW